MQHPFTNMRMMVKRKYKTLAILGCIAVIFFFLQFFSLRKLNLWSGDSRVAHSADKLSEIDDGDTFEREMAQAERDIDKDEKDKETLLTGVHLKDLKLYQPDENGFFTCHHSKVKIPMNQVNDDFCDCSDSTDEPGTNACPHSKFYCKYQMEGEEVVMVAGSKVNDGICDCCDGSDEWANHRVPFYIQMIGENEKYVVSHTPCKNSCHENLLNKAQHLRVKRIGLKLREKYLNAAKHLPAKANFGPQNVFYLLSKDCWEMKIEPYEYRICPFREVTQVEFPSGHFNLGRATQWLKVEKGNYILWMKNGDFTRCPNTARSTKIQFICGLQDQPLSIKEENKCEYSVKFSTPAAC